MIAASTKTLPQAPWFLQQDAQYGFVYVTDSRGKRLMTIYGNEEQKLAVGSWIVESFNKVIPTGEPQ